MTVWCMPSPVSPPGLCAPVTRIVKKQSSATSPEWIQPTRFMADRYLLVYMNMSLHGRCDYIIGSYVMHIHGALGQLLNSWGPHHPGPFAAPYSVKRWLFSINELQLVTEVVSVQTKRICSARVEHIVEAPGLGPGGGGEWCGCGCGSDSHATIGDETGRSM